jgi:hypothetical protein
MIMTGGLHALRRKLADQMLSSGDCLTKDVSSGPDFAYQTDGLSSK